MLAQRGEAVRAGLDAVAPPSAEPGGDWLDVLRRAQDGVDRSVVDDGSGTTVPRVRLACPARMRPSHAEPWRVPVHGEDTHGWGTTGR